MRPSFLFLITLLALGSVEGLAWWWMHPASADIGEPVLAYRPKVGSDPARSAHLSQAARNADGEPEIRGQETEIRGQEEAAAPAPSPAQSSSPNQQLVPAKPCEDGSTILNLSRQSAAATDQQSEISSSLSPSSISPSPHFSVSAFQLLPDIYRQAAPMLRCTSGQVFHVQIHDNAGLHGAFFEWDGTDTGSVLEAFRHMPEACMGSIGMILVSKEKPIHYVVRSQESEDRGQEEAPAQSTASSSNQKSTIHNPQSSIQLRDQASGVRRQEEAPAQSTASSSNQKSTIQNPQSSISSSSTDNSSTAHSLIFDHTVFRDPGQGGNPLVPGPLVHAFRAVWVAGMKEADVRRGIDGQEMNRLRTIRLKAAATRYRPTHACVIQGTVRGIANPDRAWEIFEESMLRHLTWER